MTRLGSRERGGGGGLGGVGSRGASLCLGVVVVSVRDGGSRKESRLVARRRQRNAGWTMYEGVVMPIVNESL